MFTFKIINWHDFSFYLLDFHNGSKLKPYIITDVSQMRNWLFLIRYLQHQKENDLFRFRTYCKRLIGVIFMLFAGFSSMVWADVAGKVIFVSGAVTVKHADAFAVAATRDMSLNAGDTIETQEGRAQFSLLDGAKISLQPNSVYKINRYEFSGKEDGTEYAFTELIKGGLRTISGWVGHKHPERYQLKTAVATIGIRGTEYTVNLTGNNLLMTTNSGSVDVCNAAGCLNATAGMSIAVDGVGRKPRFSSVHAVSRADQPKLSAVAMNDSSKPVFAAADVVSENGSPWTVAAAINVAEENEAENNQVLGFNGKAMVATLMKTDCACGIDDVFEASLQADYSGRPVEIKNSGTSAVINPISFDALNSHSDGVVSWGRAAGNFNNGGNDEPVQWMDYIVGARPAPGQLNNLTGTYHVFASTAPMYLDGSAAGAVNSTTGYLKFDFGTGLYDYSLNVYTVGENYQLLGNGASLDKNNPSFAANGIVTSTGLTCAENSCAPALHDGAHLVQGGFFGKQGNRAGLQYGFTTPTDTIYGSAVLK